MKKKIVLTCFLVLIIIICGCVQGLPKTIKEANVCGDGICGATEDCNSCSEDCGCKSGEYCSDIGICREYVCGDEICSPEENRTQICCEDCDCPSDKICNKVTQICQDKTTVSEEDVEKIANNYMVENDIEGTITDMEDVYYKNEIVKQVIIDCGTEEIPYPCQIILYINDDGKIVEEMRTA